MTLRGPLPTFEAFLSKPRATSNTGSDGRNSWVGRKRKAWYCSGTPTASDKVQMKAELDRMNSDYRNEDRDGYETFELVGPQIVGTYHEKGTGLQHESDWFFAKCECGTIGTFAGGNDDIECFHCGAQLEIHSRVANTAMKKLRH